MIFRPVPEKHPKRITGSFFFRQIVGDNITLLLPTNSELAYVKVSEDNLLDVLLKACMLLHQKGRFIYLLF